MFTKLASLFFAPLDAYEAAGMFSVSHLISLGVCLVLLCLAFWFSRRLTSNQVNQLTRYFAIMVTGLEFIKIGYNFYYGYTWIDAWVPLSFCSLFIYATWLSGYGKGMMKDIGDAYIVIGCVLGGLGFLLMPTTSLMRYPIWHFLCLYSLLFHMMMIYLGVLYMTHRKVRINWRTYCYFSIYFLISALICIVINTIYGSNLMILREPFNVPLPWIHQVKANSQVAYTLMAVSAYLIGPGLLAWLMNCSLKNQKK